jgi:hypothetical protein
MGRRYRCECEEDSGVLWPLLAFIAAICLVITGIYVAAIALLLAALARAFPKTALLIIAAFMVVRMPVIGIAALVAIAFVALCYKVGSTR